MLTILLGAAVLLPGPPPDVVPLMLERIRQDTAESRSLTYIQERTEYDVRGDTDRLKKRETKNVRGTGLGFFERLVAKDGKPVTNASEEPVASSMIQLSVKYDFVIIAAPAVQVDGFDCWQVAFTPRAGLRDTSDEDAILNHIRGTAYVDVHNHLIRWIHSTLSKPFRRGFLSAAHIVAIVADTRQIEWDDTKRIGIQSTTVVRLQYSVIGDTFLRIEYLNTNHQWKP